MPEQARWRLAKVKRSHHSHSPSLLPTTKERDGEGEGRGNRISWWLCVDLALVRPTLLVDLGGVGAGVEMIELVRDVLISFSCAKAVFEQLVVAGRGAAKFLDVVVWGFGLGVTSQGRKAVGLGLVDFGDLCEFGVRVRSCCPCSKRKLRSCRLRVIFGVLLRTYLVLAAYHGVDMVRFHSANMPRVAKRERSVLKVDVVKSGNDEHVIEEVEKSAAKEDPLEEEPLKEEHKISAKAENADAEMSPI
ncbi:hypothetical protein Droror1_Dr00000926 [Drosera rotundifolia]